MEVTDIIHHYVDKSKNLIFVEFRTYDDDEDNVREDFIEYSYFEEFGYENKDLSILEDFVGDDEWDDDIYDYIDEEKLISFINEYYVVFPDKLPKKQFR